MPELVLASGSPRRAELLSQIGLDYQVVIPDVDEAVHENELPMDYVARMSRQKASVVAAHLQSKTALSEKIVLAADTVVVIDGDILGKPKDKSEAISMLLRLSGATHQVITSVSVRCASRVETAVVETNVQFRVLSYAECTRYWATGEPEDKAGAYGIQGLASIFVEKINGSYSNVVGLPLTETALLLLKFGIECLPLHAEGPTSG
ncbi:MAG: septum formation inhibitor Maf [Proteobacteria bacterium]|nr:septum formation inhibitor Maf [Pseudomonadota bacterium]